MTVDEVRAALTDTQALAVTLYGECRAEPIAGILAVASVISTRARHARWWGGPSIKSVCLKKGQFSCWWELGSKNTNAVYALGEALLTKQPVGDRNLMSELLWIADGVVAERFRDHAFGADHYLTTALLNSDKAPAWAKGPHPVAVIGGHSFLSLEV